jgi:hypothetical protein
VGFVLYMEGRFDIGGSVGGSPVSREVTYGAYVRDPDIRRGLCFSSLRYCMILLLTKA